MQSFILYISLYNIKRNRRQGNYRLFESCAERSSSLNRRFLIISRKRKTKGIAVEYSSVVIGLNRGTK